MKINKDFILKTLISLGIIAVIGSLYIQYGKPYLKEFSFEKQDQVRIKDLDTLNSILKEIISASSTQPFRKNNTIYISLPSDDPTCANLDLPSVPDGWSYHCSNQSDYQKTDGTGWIPVNFSEKITQLPIDPLNNSETLNYYAYVANNNEHAITSILDSKKYLKEKAQNDSGVNSIRYEVGNNLKLWGDAEELIGYWPMETFENKVIDYSRNGNDGTIYGDPNTSQGILGNAVVFKANNDFVDMGIKPTDLLSKKPNFTMSVWFKTDSNLSDDGVIGGIYGGNYKGFSIRQEHTGSVVFLVGQGGNTNNEITITSTINTWNYAVLTYDGDKIRAYLNGNRIKEYSTNFIDNNSNHDFILGRNPWDNVRQFKGVLDEITLYHRALSKQEIQNYYYRIRK